MAKRPTLAALIRIPTASPATAILCFRETKFCGQRKRVQKWRCPSNARRPRPKSIVSDGWAGRPRTAFLKNLVARWGPTNCQDNHGKQQTPDNPDGCPTRVVGRTPTMFHNTLVVGSSIRKPGKSSKTAKRPAICMGVRPGELVGHQPHSITLWLIVRVRPSSTTQSRANRRIPTLWTVLGAISNSQRVGRYGWHGERP